MTRRCVLAVFVAGLLIGGGAPAAESYDAPSRTAYLRRALAALRASPPAELAALQDALDRAQRTTCHSSSHDLNVRCLARTGVQQCPGAEDRDRCLLVADLAVTNKLSESSFVSVAQRYELMRTEKRYREAFRAVLHQERAQLATELLLAGPGCAVDDDVDASGAAGGDDCLASAVDAFCAGQSKRSWHHCAAALIWFMAGAAQ